MAKQVEGGTPESAKKSGAALAEVLSKSFSTEELDGLVKRLALGPQPLRELLFMPDPIGPTPRFIYPGLPWRAPIMSLKVGGFPFGLKANKTHGGNYTLKLYLVAPGGASKTEKPLYLTGPSGDVSATNVPIDGTIGGSSSYYTIKKETFTTLTEGVYLLVVTANSLGALDPLYGTTVSELEATTT